MSSVGKKRKPRKSYVRKIDPKKLRKVAVKHAGNQSKAAEELNVSHQAVSQYLKEHPELDRKIKSELEFAMNTVGMTRVKYLTRINEALDAGVRRPNHDIRLKAAKVTAQLYGDLKPAGPSVVMNVAQIFLPELKAE